MDLPRGRIAVAGVCALALAWLLLAAGCVTEEPAATGAPVPRDLGVEVLNPDRPAALRCNPDVRIARKVSEQELASLAGRLLAREAQGCRFGVATFYLPSMRPGAGAWAIAELGDEVAVSILGLGSTAEEALLERARGRGQVLGLWVDDTSYASVVSLHRDGSGLKLTRWYADDGVSTDPIRIVEGQHGYELHDASGRADRHYRLGEGGALETWYGSAFLAAARQVRLDADLGTLMAQERERLAQHGRAAAAGRSRRRAAAEEERWRKFEQWLETYRSAVEPARSPVLYLGALQDEAERQAACRQLVQVIEAVPAGLAPRPAGQIDLAPLLQSLDRVRDACASGLDVKVMYEASRAAGAWRRLDASVERVVAELHREEGP